VLQLGGPVEPRRRPACPCRCAHAGRDGTCSPRAAYARDGAVARSSRGRWWLAHARDGAHARDIAVLTLGIDQDVINEDHDNLIDKTVLGTSFGQILI
jgi:hypothetical protein